MSGEPRRDNPVWKRKTPDQGRLRRRVRYNTVTTRPQSPKTV